MPTLGEQLTEARAAYHRLQLGELAVSFRDGNGEQVEYNRASAPGWPPTSTTLNGRQWASKAPSLSVSKPQKD